MAKVVRGVDDYKKEFLRLFDSLCGKYSRWEVWSDFIQLTAIDMSNATDKVNAPKRMETGKTIRKKYRDADIRHLRGCEPQGVALDWKNTDIFLSSLQPSTICMMVICWRENISAIRIVCLSTPISLRII